MRYDRGPFGQVPFGQVSAARYVFHDVGAWEDTVPLAIAVPNDIGQAKTICMKHAGLTENNEGEFEWQLISPPGLDAPVYHQGIVWALWHNGKCIHYDVYWIQTRQTEGVESD